MRFGARATFGLSLILLLVTVAGSAQESPPSEYRLKAAFLFNFAKFVEWPASAFADSTSPFVIGVLGENPFGSDLEQTVRGKVINERLLSIKLFRSPTEATNCHILFISTSEKKQFSDIFNTLKGVPVLTVGETDQFIDSGGMINFVMEDKKIRFQINNETAKREKLQISSKLLSLAIPAR
jgi:hypothetical protein